MITLDMGKKFERVRISDIGFSLENNLVTLEMSVVDGAEAYLLTGKTVTAVFYPSGVETAPLTVTDGVIYLPITSELIRYGHNDIQLFFRWTDGTQHVENAPIMYKYFEESLLSLVPADGSVDIITSLIAQVNQAIIDVGEVSIGTDGASAYQIAVNNGFIGTEIEWIASLDGKDGEPGVNGVTPEKGTDYFTSSEITTIETDTSTIVKNAIMDNGAIDGFKVRAIDQYNAIGTAVTDTDNIVYMIVG